MRGFVGEVAGAAVDFGWIFDWLGELPQPWKLVVTILAGIGTALSVLKLVLEIRILLLRGGLLAKRKKKSAQSRVRSRAGAEPPVFGPGPIGEPEDSGSEVRPLTVGLFTLSVVAFLVGTAVFIALNFDLTYHNGS